MRAFSLLLLVTFVGFLHAASFPSSGTFRINAINPSNCPTLAASGMVGFTGGKIAYLNMTTYDGGQSDMEVDAFLTDSTTGHDIMVSNTTGFQACSRMDGYLHAIGLALITPLATATHTGTTTFQGKSCNVYVATGNVMPLFDIALTYYVPVSGSSPIGLKMVVGGSSSTHPLVARLLAAGDSATTITLAFSDFNPSGTFPSRKPSFCPNWPTMPTEYTTTYSTSTQYSGVASMSPGGFGMEVYSASQGGLYQMTNSSSASFKFIQISLTMLYPTNVTTYSTFNGKCSCFYYTSSLGGLAAPSGTFNGIYGMMISNSIFANQQSMTQWMEPGDTPDFIVMEKGQPKTFGSCYDGSCTVNAVKTLTPTAPASYFQVPASCASVKCSNLFSNSQSN